MDEGKTAHGIGVGGFSLTRNTYILNYDRSPVSHASQPPRQLSALIILFPALRFGSDGDAFNKVVTSTFKIGLGKGQQSQLLPIGRPFGVIEDKTEKGLGNLRSRSSALNKALDEKTAQLVLAIEHFKGHKVCFLFSVGILNLIFNFFVL